MTGEWDGTVRPPTVRRSTVARLMREAITDQGWSVIRTMAERDDASWAKAADRLCDYLERRGVEVTR